MSRKSSNNADVTDTPESPKTFSEVLVRKPGSRGRIAAKDRTLMSEHPMSFKCTYNQEQSYRLTAFYCGVDISVWIRNTLDAASIRPGQIPPSLQQPNEN